MEQRQTIHYDELVERCKRGDSSAFTALYHRHAKELYNSIYRIVGHTAEAEDLLQDSFVVAFQQIQQFEYRSHFGAWIKRIAINKAISVLRKKKVRFTETTLSHDPAAEEPIDEADFALKVADVQKAIAQLPEGYRTIVQLYLIEGIPQEEISTLLGISYSTVRTQYHRAKASIWKTLKQGGVS